MRRFPCPIGRIERALRNDSHCALVFHHRSYVGRRKLFHRTCGKGGGHEGDGSATNRRLLFLVRTSFASQRPTMVDRNMAIEQAFMVCKTEESKLQAFEKSPSVSAHRDTLREELLRR